MQTIYILLIVYFGVMGLLAYILFHYSKSSKMTNTEMIRRVTTWQEAGFTHPLTCAKGSNHALLVPIEQNGKVVMECPTCKQIHLFIPPIVLQTPPEIINRQRERLEKAGAKFD